MSKIPLQRRRPTELIAGKEFISRVALGSRVLLVVHPVYDYRLDWSKWQQPSGLLQLATCLQQRTVDVKLIDSLEGERGTRLSRKKIITHDVDGYKFNKWQIGLSVDGIGARVSALRDDGWHPDSVLVSCGNTVWWEAARDTISLLRELLPKARLVLGGAYPSCEPEHALQNSGADLVVTGSVPQAMKRPSAIGLYPNVPYSAGIYFYGSPSIHSSKQRVTARATSSIMREIRNKAQAGVRELVFFDSEIRIADREAFTALLRQIAFDRLDVHFVLPGNVSPQLITRDLARQLRRAQVTQVYLRSDVDWSQGSIVYPTGISEYERCINALLSEQVISPRDGGVAAMQVVGLPYEDLDVLSERLIRLAHVVGSVMLVPFQYVSGVHRGAIFDRALAKNGHFPPEAFNSKLFKLARLSGKTIEEYMELMRLAALLNSKFRSKTFDFLGATFAAKLFRQSLRSGTWNPFPDRQAQPVGRDISLAIVGQGAEHDRP